jgi:tetratricopeptide (TPR) repeat protein
VGVGSRKTIRLKNKQWGTGITCRLVSECSSVPWCCCRLRLQLVFKQENNVKTQKKGRLFVFGFSHVFYIVREEGNVHFRNGNIVAAKDRYNDALDELKFCPPELHERQQRDAIRRMCYLNLAQCYLELKEWRYAERVAKSALELDPNNVKGLYRLAKALVGRGEVLPAHVVTEKLATLQLSDDEKKALSVLKKEMEPKLAKARARETRVQQPIVVPLASAASDPQHDDEEEHSDSHE